MSGGLGGSLRLDDAGSGCICSLRQGLDTCWTQPHARLNRLLWGADLNFWDLNYIGNVCMEAPKKLKQVPTFFDHALYQGPCNTGAGTRGSSGHLGEGFTTRRWPWDIPPYTSSPS